MKTEIFEKAEELQIKIDFLEKKIKSFNPSNKWVYLNICDKDGNKRDVIETYAFSEVYRKTMGYSFDNIIGDSYGIFLDTVRIKMQERIDFLKSEFDKL